MLHCYVAILFFLIYHGFVQQSVVALKSTDGIDFLGRFYLSTTTGSGEDHQPALYTADWPGSGIRFSIHPQQTRVNITISFAPASTASFLYYVGMFVDGKQVQKYAISPNQLQLDFSYETTVNHINVIMMRKLTEANLLEARGNMTLTGLEVRGGSMVKASPAQDSKKKKKLFVIGDSITCGYGVGGRNARCDFSAVTEDVSQAFAFLLASSLDMDVDVICWSGLGVVRNYGDPKPLSELPMTALYNRTLATVSPDHVNTSNQRKKGSLLWQASLHPADLVVIALGTNDYSTNPNPPDDEFIQTYVQLIHQIRVDHPHAKVLATCEPMTRGKQCGNIQQAADQSKVPFFEIPPRTLSGGKGCHFHPNRKSQQNIADALLPVVSDLLIKS